jgi:hypothetical protein
VSWQPGPRPAWVRHALAGEGAPELASARRPLDADELVAEATFRAGGDREPGSTGSPLDDSFREPLGIIVRSIEGEADLHLVGRWRVREVIVRYLESRFRASAWLERDPGIEREEILAPIIVTGSPRAGTSIVHELLASPPGHRAPMAWEYWSPAPPPDPSTHDSDPRIALANDDVRLSAALVPGFDGMHEQGARIPREDGSAMGLDLRSDLLPAHYGVPSYREHLASDDMRSAYAWLRRVLQVLQRRFPSPTWVLKWPGHANHLDVALETFPDARIVVCHRDPLAMLSSVTSLVATLRWAHSNAVDFQAVAREQATVFAEQCDRLLAWRTRTSVDPSRIVDLRFDELVADPARVTMRALEHLGVESGPEVERGVSGLLAGKPRGRHGGHEHHVGALGLDPAELRKRFAAYQERFAIPSEDVGG